LAIERGFEVGSRPWERGDAYVGQQRLSSHAVHGTTVDLVMRHLTKGAGGFQPESDMITG
jgi:hypothetical protein